MATLIGWWSDRHGIYTSYFRNFVLSVSGRSLLCGGCVCVCTYPSSIFFFFLHNFRSHFCFFFFTEYPWQLCVISARYPKHCYRFPKKKIIIIATFSNFRRIRLSSLSRATTTISTVTAGRRAAVKTMILLL